MAVIGTIRKQSAFLVIIIGVALAAFVLGDFTKSRRMGSRDVNVGVVDGEDITIMDFNEKVDQNIEATKQNQKKDRLTYDETFRVRNETWKQMVNQILLDKEYDAIGLTVTSDELFNMITGPNPHPLIVQSFKNPQTDQFDPSLVTQFLQSLDQNRPEVKQQWFLFENYLKTDRLRTKYNALISKGYYVPTALAKIDYQEDNDKANIEYITKKYVEIADSLITPTDADYERAYEKHKERFKQEAYRDFDYVAFEIKPSPEDLKAAGQRMEEIYEDFKKTEDVVKFVMLNSDTPYDSTWKRKGQLPVQVDSIMFNSEIGTVVKPYLEKDMYHVARLVDVANRPDSLKASHILISYAGALRAGANVTRTKEQAEKLADSLYNVLKGSTKNMVKLAKEYSDDPSVNTNDGDLGWFADGAMVPSFNEAVIDTKRGHVTMVESPFGFHVIKVTGKKDPEKKVKVAFVNREVLASNETNQKIFAKASKLAAESHNIEEFNAAVEDNKLNRKIAPRVHIMDDKITGLKNPREIVKWAFNEDRQVGDVSEVFSLEDQYVVAVMTTIAEEGYPPVDQVKNRLTTYVYSDLKGKIIIDEMNAAGGNFEAVDQSGKFKKDQMAALTFNSRNIKGYGIENDVIGRVFGTKDGGEFGPLRGNGAVFLVKVNKITRVSDQDNYNDVISKLQNSFLNRVNQGAVYTALEDAADIQDNRVRFY